MGSLLKYIISKIVINISLIPQINIFFLNYLDDIIIL